MSRLGQRPAASVTLPKSASPRMASDADH